MPNRTKNTTKRQPSNTILTPHHRRERQLHICLVDKDEKIYAAVGEIAKSEGWALDYYPDGRRALQNIPLNPPDIVLMAVRLSGISGIECVQRLKRRVPCLPVVMLTTCTDFESIIMSLMAGATGYMLKPFSPIQLKATVNCVRGGGIVLCQAAQKSLLQFIQCAVKSPLTSVYSRRELQIMLRLVQNLSDKEIGQQLGIATNTVHAHLVRIFKRLGVHDRNGAVQRFLNLRTNWGGSLAITDFSPAPDPGGASARLQA